MPSRIGTATSNSTTIDGSLIGLRRSYVGCLLRVSVDAGLRGRGPEHNTDAMRVEGWRTTLAGAVPDVRRIVSIAPSNTEILHALGLGRRIVGVDRWSDYPPGVLRLPRVGSDLRVDVERVTALEPELVVASLH